MIFCHQTHQTPHLAAVIFLQRVIGKPGKPGKRCSVGQILSIGRQVLRALIALHDLCLVHRDIKALNVLIDEERNAKVKRQVREEYCGMLSVIDQNMTSQPLNMYPDAAACGEPLNTWLVLVGVCVSLASILGYCKIMLQCKQQS